MVNLLKYISSGSERTSKLKKNAVGSILIKGWSILISLILVPLTMDYLSPDIYGVWLTVSSVILWLNFFDIGFTLGLKNKLTEALAHKDYKRGKKLVSTTYGMMILIFVPLGIGLEFIVPVIDWSGFLNVPKELNEQLISVMRILVICFSLQMIFNTITAILAAFQKVAISTVFPVIGNTISVFAIYILTKTAPPSIVSLAEAISFIPIIVLIIATIILFSKSFKKVSPSLKYFDKSAIRILFSLGAKFFIIQIQVVVLFQATNVLISNVSSPEQVTAYNIAYKYLSIATMFFTILLGPLWPAYTDAYAREDYAWMKRTYSNMKKILGIVILGIIIMAFISPFVYRIWLGRDASVVPWMMTVAVALYMIINSWDGLQVYLINGIGAIKIQTYVTLIGLIFHIPLSLWLGKYIGAIGVVCSMIIINTIYASIFTIQTNKLVNGIRGTIWNR